MFYYPRERRRCLWSLLKALAGRRTYISASQVKSAKKHSRVQIKNTVTRKLNECSLIDSRTEYLWEVEAKGAKLNSNTQDTLLERSLLFANDENNPSETPNDEEPDDKKLSTEADAPDPMDIERPPSKRPKNVRSKSNFEQSPVKLNDRSTPSTSTPCTIDSVSQINLSRKSDENLRQYLRDGVTLVHKTSLWFLKLNQDHNSRSAFQDLWELVLLLQCTSSVICETLWKHFRPPWRDCSIHTASAERSIARKREKNRSFLWFQMCYVISNVSADSFPICLSFDSSIQTFKWWLN